MNKHADLVARLEAATARLEDIATSTLELPQAVPALAQSVGGPPSNNNSTPAPLPPPPAPVAPKAPPEPVPESVEDFDAFITSSVVPYVNISKKIGGLVAEQVRLPPCAGHSSR